MDDKWFEKNTVKDIFGMLGGNYDVSTGKMKVSLNGTLTCIGASRFVINFEKKNSDVKTINGNDYFDFGCGISFRPNFGKKNIKFFVTYNLSDEIDLFIFKIWGAKSTLVNKWIGLPGENIAEIIEREYDEMVKEECGGIPI